MMDRREVDVDQEVEEEQEVDEAVATMHHPTKSLGILGGRTGCLGHSLLWLLE